MGRVFTGFARRPGHRGGQGTGGGIMGATAAILPGGSDLSEIKVGAKPDTIIQVIAPSVKNFFSAATIPAAMNTLQPVGSPVHWGGAR
jgi:hypothetical protein